MRVTVGDDVLQVKLVYEATPALFSNLVCPEASVPMFGDHPLGPEDMRLWVLATGGSATRHPDLSGTVVLDSVAVVYVRPVPGQ